ncbi:MAG: cation diffusion facilitator family transporter [Mariprofundaceae bacterium]|nr:cation diffusion facilitator family transporter [Mariprofundaceae bacterium]
MHKHAHHSLKAALWLTASFALVELVGGLLAGSLALLADAGHMVSDIVALGLAVLAGNIAKRPPHARMTYGYGRARVLAAQFNGLGLWFLSGWIVWEGIGRLSSPPPVNGGMVLSIAVIGLVINLAVLKWLHGGHDINTRAAYWHVLGDALGSVAAIVAGLVILLTGWMPIDPILSFLVAGILAWGGWRLVRETTMELMEGVPLEVDVGDIERLMRQVEGVTGIHHMHIWRLPDAQLAISAHVQVESMDDWPSVLFRLQERLGGQGIGHATLQPEISCRDSSHHCQGRREDR